MPWVLLSQRCSKNSEHKSHTQFCQTSLYMFLCKAMVQSPNVPECWSGTLGIFSFLFDKCLKCIYLLNTHLFHLPVVQFISCHHNQRCNENEFIAYIFLYLVVKVRDDDLLVKLLEEFPHLHISQHTMNKMWRQQLAQTEQLKAASGRARLKLQNEVQQALKKHELLVAIIKKDRDHNKRLQELKQRIYRQKWTQSKVREKRQQVVRARKYYEDYRVQLRAKMMRARTREERIFKNLFEEGLEIQKQRLKDLRAYAQERRAEQRREHQNELESMENYYRDQFSMLAEALSQERQEIQTREKAQAQMLQKTKRELRSRMEKEIQQLQTAIMQNDDETFFQELEADRLRSRLQMASFQYNKSGFS
uniref:Centrosomal protein 95 n=1 Tax=Phasianus colchicus TaxID=9054 RepID=A0A669PWS3_PHACC